MDKHIFFEALKKRLTELKIHPETIDDHINIFDKCFLDKSDSEISTIIESMGGVDGIISAVYDLETTKSKNANIDAASDIENNNEMTKEISAVPDDELDKHIREAESMTKELEKTAINNAINNQNNVEFADDISEYDFEVLFAEKISIPEQKIKDLRDSISEEKYKKTLPLAMVAIGLMFFFVSLLFPLLILSSIFVAISFIGILVLGICFSLVPIGYSVFISFSNNAIALYESGIGLVVLGLTMMISNLLYNYNKRLVPFLFKKLVECFKICVKISKLYFNNETKEDKKA